MEAENNFEVRALTLKKWGIPQTGSIEGIATDNVEKYGNFASFQSHHFIDVSSCEMSRIQDVYERIREMRQYQHSGKTPGAHIVQTIALIGERTGFWDKPIQFVYVTFIQLASFNGWSYEAICDTIESIMAKHFGEENRSMWSLYCSYDFCDLVLFTKGIKIDSYNKVLWEIALVREDGLNLVRDTFTLYGFNSHFLIDSFRRLERGEPIEWTESMALSVNLSIYSLTDWKKFQRKLGEKKIRYHASHISGRYDVCLITKNLTGEQIVWLLKCIDEVYNSQDYKLPSGFGGYEITPLWRAENIQPSNDMPPNDTDFIRYANELLKRICDDEYGVADTYIKETVRSLKELIQNGFSIEFVLDVLPSFSAVAKNFKMTTGEQNALSLKQRDKYEHAVQEYFDALNILTLCTMHGERRFIQAPAFSATYFDIPPKLMGFYGALSFYISRALNGLYENGESDNYQVLLTPDYRSGINVVPICQERANECVMIIYLAEKYFYDPLKAVYLLCHEMAHYLGERFRKDRRESVFFTLSLHMLVNTPLCQIIPSRDLDYLNDTTEGKTLLGILAREYASFLDEHFRDEYQGSNRDMFVNIKEFLENCNCGLIYLQDSIRRVQMISNFRDKLAVENKALWKEITKVLTSIQAYFRLSPFNNANEDEVESSAKDEPIVSTYLTDMYNSNSAGSKKYACEILASYVIDGLLDVNTLGGKDILLPHFQYVETTMSAYREAYADIRMIELLDDRFDIDIYEMLLKEVRVAEADFECNVRHDAVIYATDLSEERRFVNPPKTEDRVEWAAYSDYFLTVRSIAEYLRICHRKVANSDEIKEIVRVFSGKDLCNQYKLVLRTIASYEEEMVLYCKNNV